ncbi:MAG: NACHT domain-containing protein [Cyanobacteria bacterium P01_E01_bin.6]
MSQPQPPESEPNSTPPITIRDSETIHLVAGDGNIQGSENQAVSGTGNQVTQTIIQKQEFHHHAAQAAASKRPKAEQILLNAVATEVTDRLNQSLHNAVFINLPKENQRDRVRRPWDGDVKIGTGEKQPIPAGQTVFQVFRQGNISGKLLLLGEPGSGKTTTLLDLAHQLVQTAQADSDESIPVLFNLSSWGRRPASTGDDQATSLARWMVDELNSKYGVRKQVGQDWLAHQTVLPLLDGLDEVAASRLVDCLYAINQFLVSAAAPAGMVVCCREE